MRMLAMLVVFGSVLLAAEAFAQSPADKAATDAETRTVADIVDCMVAGLPDDWRSAAMEVNLEKPMDETGGVRYLMTRDENDSPHEPFTPCDVKKPARLLLELRGMQPPERRGWIGAQVSIRRDGRFGIRYGYPGR